MTAIDQTILSAVAGGAAIAFSLSGGKDSTVATHAAMLELDRLGHPRADRIAIHADLGRAEWKSTPATVEAVASHFGLPLLIVRHSKHDMVSRWEARFSEGKRRYAELEVFNLIGPWSSASLRFCTAELKQQVIAPALQRHFPGRTIISVVGIRREESPARKLAPVSKHDARWDRRDGTHLITWHPALELSSVEVFARHNLFGLPLHEAYMRYGSSRVSCAFCVLQSHGDQRAAALAAGNLPLLEHLVRLEAESTFSFQPDRWLADVRPDLLSPRDLAEIAVAKRRAIERRSLEAALPAGLRYVKGWPPREPTHDEAVAIVGARARILAHHGLPVLFPRAEDVIARFRDLMAEQSARPGTRGPRRRTGAGAAMVMAA